MLIEHNQQGFIQDFELGGGETVASFPGPTQLSVVAG